MCITFEADRRGLESFAGNDLLVHGKCVLSPYPPYCDSKFEDYFSVLEFDQSIDWFFTWGTDLKSTLVERIMDYVFNRLICSSVYWEPIDDFYDGLVPGCQYMEWEENCDDTIMRSVGQARRIVCANEDGSLLDALAPGNIAEYTYYRKIVSESNGALMLLQEDDGSLRLARRKLFRAEWHHDAMFGNFKLTLNHFTRELGL